MAKIDVSVIVPVYNVEEYLDRCLKSLVNQDIDNMEIIVVNDGSGDNSQKIIDRYVRDYPSKIVAYKKKNGGVASARNFGLDKARGDYVLFVDSDDYVTNDYVSTLYNKAFSTNSDIAICNMYETYSDRKEIMRAIRDINDDIKKNALISLPACWNKIYRKNLFFDNNIYFPEIWYGEDMATTMRLVVSAKKIEYVDKELYYYVQRDNSAMNQKKYNPKNLDVFKSLDVLEEFFVDRGYYDVYKDEIEYLYIEHLMHAYTLRVYRYREGKEGIDKALKLIKDNYKNWSKNKYFKMESLKYKIVCYLIYLRQIWILKLILR